MRGVPSDLSGLVGEASAGNPRAVARLISVVEDGSDRLPELTRLLLPTAGRAMVVGITGSPGVGKSTTTSALVSHYRARGMRVGVLAVDPSSPFSGGALLGDRIRMQEHATDPEVFIRSMASRGHLGGLASATPAAVRVLDAAGCDIVFIETVGVGQSEIEVVRVADTVLVLLAPGMGDGVQAAKAGILEIGDVFVVNKADRDGAGATSRELRHMISLAARESGQWEPPVLQTVASTGKGIDEVGRAIDDHWLWAENHGQLRVRRVARVREEIDAIAVAEMRRRFGQDVTDSRLGRLAERVVDGLTDPYSAADDLLADWGPHGESSAGLPVGSEALDDATSVGIEREGAQ